MHLMQKVDAYRSGNTLSRIGVRMRSLLPEEARQAAKTRRQEGLEGGTRLLQLRLAGSQRALRHDHKEARELSDSDVPNIRQETGLPPLRKRSRARSMVERRNGKAQEAASIILRFT